jgi:hypothetical protein
MLKCVYELSVILRLISLDMVNMNHKIHDLFHFHPKTIRSSFSTLKYTNKGFGLRAT